MSTSRILTGLLFAAGLGLAAPAAGADPSPAVAVSDAVVRASIGGAANSAAYMVIANSGGQADRLLSAACACAAKVVAHDSHPMAGMPDMMEMTPTGPVIIPAHGSVRFHPGGLHLMLTGLKGKLVDGGDQAITLVFEHAGKVSVDFKVRSTVGAGAERPH